MIDVCILRSVFVFLATFSLFSSKNLVKHGCVARRGRRKVALKNVAGGAPTAPREGRSTTLFRRVPPNADLNRFILIASDDRSDVLWFGVIKHGITDVSEGKIGSFICHDSY